MTKLYFVRHAQPEHAWKDDRTRPLTEEGKKDSKQVLEFLKDKKIDAFYSSPYKRSIDTIAETAEFYGKQIETDERLREREKGLNGNNHGMFQKRWADLQYHEDGGESIAMVQERNMAALKEILIKNKDKNIVIGTHGTALSSILRYYHMDYNCESFLRIIDWMPYIIELDFNGETLVHQEEQLYVQKKFKGKEGEDKKQKQILGSIVMVTIDRPLGSYHPKHKDLYYPVNYGYIKGVMAADGEEQDAYVIGLDEPVGMYEGKVIAIIHRKNDIEEKWVVCPNGASYTVSEIEELVGFQEQYFDSEIECLCENKG